ncbi:MAG: D-cysteine desulfhydrase family protein [Anaerolineales bacterium]
MNPEAPPKVNLAHLPTPVHKLERLTVELAGPDLWIKRDDLTGHAFGGNKIRKLEYLIADAQAQKADTLITAGAVQSNHCRQTAGAAARFGMKCILVLEGHGPPEQTGNVLLDLLFGAQLVWAQDRELLDALHNTHAAVAEGGSRPYLVPFGGSSAIGSAGYVEAMEEFLNQGLEVDRIVVPVTSGGTTAGLLAGASIHGFAGKLTPIRIGRYEGAVLEKLAAHAKETAALFGHQLELDPREIDVQEGYLSAGYAVLTDLEREAITTFARLEGILLDPVYTGRAAGGMLDLIRGGTIRADERVLFWHTGGTPALFAYGDELLS